MSFFNNIEKIAYRKHTDDPVVLQEYIKFTDEKQKEKYLVFKFKNNLTQRVKEIKVLVNLFDKNNMLIGTTTFVYKNFVAKGLEEFVPTAKLDVNYDTKYIEVKVIYALFDTLVWEEEKLTQLKNVSFESDVAVDTKTKKISKKVEKEKAPKGSRKTKLKDISKGNKVVFPKVLAGLLSLVLIGITVYGVYNAKTNSKSFSDSNFEYEITSSKQVAITKYVGKSTKVVIPAKYKDYSVTAIEEEAFNSSKVKTVSFEGGKITIKSNAFIDCSSLVEVIDTVGAVRTVNKNGFNNCSKLLRVELVKAKLLPNAFSQCDALESLSIFTVEGDEFVSCGAPYELLSLTVVSVDITSSSYFDGYADITELFFTGDSIVSNDGLAKLTGLKTLHIGKDAEVMPTVLKNFRYLTVYLEEGNVYKPSDYKKYNSKLSFK
jgi:hypothetical protein